MRALIMGKDNATGQVKFAHLEGADDFDLEDLVASVFDVDMAGRLLPIVARSFPGYAFWIEEIAGS